MSERSSPVTCASGFSQPVRRTRRALLLRVANKAAPVEQRLFVRGQVSNTTGTPTSDLLADCTLPAEGRQRQVGECDTALLSEACDSRVSIQLSEDNALQSRPHDEFEASEARARSHIDGSARDSGASRSGLQDGVGLAVNRPNTVAVFHQTAYVLAVRLTRQTPVVPRRDGPVVENDDRAYVLARTGSFRRGDEGLAHEVQVRVFHSSFLIGVTSPKRLTRIRQSCFGSNFRKSSSVSGLSVQLSFASLASTKATSKRS